jgi:hypothetical protein
MRSTTSALDINDDASDSETAGPLIASEKRHLLMKHIEKMLVQCSPICDAAGENVSATCDDITASLRRLREGDLPSVEAKQCHYC